MAKFCHAVRLFYGGHVVGLPWHSQLGVNKWKLLARAWARVLHRAFPLNQSLQMQPLVTQMSVACLLPRSTPIVRLAPYKRKTL